MILSRRFLWYLHVLVHFPLKYLKLWVLAILNSIATFECFNA